jgi:SpoVK/Ycf46/Vps4 family AAA+-type ATPase
VVFHREERSLKREGTVEPGAAPDFQIEGLWHALARLDRMLERATTAADAAAATAAVEPYRGLYITSEDVKRLVRRSPGEPLLAGAEADAGVAMPAGSRFPWLQQMFGLEAIDVDIVLIALAPEIDLRYERLFAYLHDDVTRRRPSVDLALNLLCASREAKIVARGRFAPDAPLLRHKLLQLLPDVAGPAPTLLAHVLKLDDAIVRFLLGQGGLDGRLQSIARLETDVAAGVAHAGPADAAMTRAMAAGSLPHFYLEGVASGEKAAAAGRLAARLRSPLIALDLGRALSIGGDSDAVLDIVFREAQLRKAVVFLDDMDALVAAERSAFAQVLERRLQESSGVVVAAGERPCSSRFKTMTSVPIEEAGFHERQAAWSAALAEQGLPAEGGHVDELAARYRLSDIQISNAVSDTVRQAALMGTRPAPADLARAARLQVRRDPGTLARKISPFYTWSDLVLPDDQIAQLEELCRQARHRHVVYGDWGFDRKLSLGKGLSALFSGPPGTGKTMAVEVIANDLGLDLFKIDLSQVVSKYIGETEKNMDRLFTEARAGNAILFFDECDALFGKRTTVQDAHDRYANIEIAYLLQKLDEHDGLSILASNLRQNLDAAFTRRLTFIIEFPFPDDDSRRRIWHSIWPAQVPRSKDLDLEFMATQFKLPGGAVKNIAVAAAFLAAEARSELTTEHLLWATRRELEKSGRRVARSEFGRYGERIEAMAGGGMPS